MALAAAAGLVWPGVASTAPVAILEVAGLGFAGRARLGAWTPVWIDVTARSADIDGTVIIEAPSLVGQPAVRFGAPVRAAAGARVRVFVPATFFDSRAPGTAYLVDVHGQRAAVPLPRLRPADELVLVLSSLPVGVEEIVAASDRLDVVYVHPETLPPAWRAYEAVRLLIVRTLDERRLDDAQRTALRYWVWAGGRLLIMPDGDDARALAGPTVEPLRHPGQSGRGRVIVWDRDAASPEGRTEPRMRQAWREALAADPIPSPHGLEGALPAGRPFPLRSSLVIGALILVYVLAVRRLSRVLAPLRLAGVAAAVLAVALATAGAWRLAALVRAQASGAVTVSVVEVLPAVGAGVLTILARTVAPPSGLFEITTTGALLLRPLSAAPVTAIHGPDTIIRGRGSGVHLVGTGVVPAPISGTYAVGGAGPTATVTNRSGRPLERPWIFAGGRVQAVGAIDGAARLALDEQRWQAHDRLPRTEVHHPLLVWAFARLARDDILRAPPAWLVGWWRDPALGLRWNGRPEPPLQLVLVPLDAPP